MLKNSRIALLLHPPIYYGSQVIQDEHFDFQAMIVHQWLGLPRPWSRLARVRVWCLGQEQLQFCWGWSSAIDALIAAEWRDKGSRVRAAILERFRPCRWWELVHPRCLATVRKFGWVHLETRRVGRSLSLAHCSSPLGPVHLLWKPLARKLFPSQLQLRGGLMKDFSKS